MKRREANDDNKKKRGGRKKERREKCANLRGLSIEERASLSLRSFVHSAALLEAIAEMALVR